MNVFRSIADAVFPATCAACGQVLVAGESLLCLDCFLALPSADEVAIPNNPLEQRLALPTGCHAAAAAYRYRQGSSSQHIVHAMKFHTNPELCLRMGRYLGQALLSGGRFDGVDLLMPVPLHWTRRLRRGYNQSLLLCEGIAQVMPRPIESHVLVRRRRTHKQSRTLSSLRTANVDHAFAIVHPERIAHRHVLLVDDVATTGATLIACADALRQVPHLQLSIATLCHTF